MGQEDIIKLLEDNPRLTTREIAEELEKQLSAVSRCLYTLLDNKEIKALQPSPEDIQRIMEKYPGSITKAFSRIKVFEVNHDI